MSALRALLGGIVDYAGLFPPAALDMSTAVRNFAAYRHDPDAWMLGRFVVPIVRLDEFATARAALTGERDRWQLTALFGADPERDIEQARAFNRVHGARWRSIDSLEGKLSTPSDIERVGRGAGDEFALFVELPDDRDHTDHRRCSRRWVVHERTQRSGLEASRPRQFLPRSASFDSSAVASTPAFRSRPRPAFIIRSGPSIV